MKGTLRAEPASGVAQTFSLLYRRFAIGKVSADFHPLEAVGRAQNGVLPGSRWMLPLSPSDGARESLIAKCARMTQFFSLAPSDGERVRERGNIDCIPINNANAD